MKTRSIILLVLASLFGLVLLAIIGLYLALRSPSVTSAFVPGLQDVLKDTAGMDTTFGDISVDLLGDIDLKNITAKNADMDVTIPAMTLDYSVKELIAGRLVVNSFALTEPTIKMKLVDDGSPKEPEPEEEPAKPLPQLIDHWLNTPDVFINLDNIAVKDADFDVQLENPTGTTAVLLNDVNLNLSTRHVKGSLSADLDFSLAKGQRQALTITPKDAKAGEMMRLAVAPHAALDIAVELKELATNSWQLLVKAPKLALDANDLDFHSRAQDAELKAGLAAHTLAAKILATIAIKGEGESVTILPGDVDIDIASSERGLRLYQTGVAPDPEDATKTIPTGMNLAVDAVDLKLVDRTTSISTAGLKPFLTKLTSDLSGKLTLAKVSFQDLTPVPPASKKKGRKPSRGPSRGPSQKPPILIERGQLDLGSKIVDGAGDIDLDFVATQIKGLPGLKQAPNLKAKASGDVDFNQQKFALDVQAGDQFNNRLALKETYAPSAQGHPLLSHDLTFQLTEALDRYFPKPLLRQDIGYYRGTLKGTTAVGGPVDLFALDIDRYAAYPAKADIKLTLTQTKPSRSRMLVHRKPLTVSLKADYGEQQTKGGERAIDAQLAVAGDDVQLKGLRGRVPLRLTAAVAAPVDITQSPPGLPRADAQVAVKAGKGLPQALNADVAITNAPNRLGLKAQLMGNLNRQLLSLVPPLAKAKLFGSRYYGLWRVDGNWRGSVAHPRATILAFEPSDQARSRVNVTGNLKVAQTARGRLARMQGPLTLRHKVNGSLKKGQLTANLVAPGAQLAGLTSFRNLKVDSVNDYRLGKGDNHDFATTTTLGIQQVRPDKKLVPVKGIAPFLNDIALDVRGSIAKMDRFDLKKLTLRARQKAKGGKDNIAVDVKGSGSLKNLALQATGKVKADFPKAKIADVGLQGEAAVPFSATASRNANKNLANLALAIKPAFDSFSVATPDFALANLSGTFSIDEQIIVNTKTKKAKFQYIQAQDPFKRVDYGRIEPFLQKENMISADKITFGSSQIGPFRANLAVEQNHVTLPYIATEVLDGWYVGKMFLDFKPSQLKLGYLGRITQINLGKLMPSGSADDGKRFSSRLGLELDINRALLEGKVDVTEIGRTQLLQVLDALDPSREDAKLNQARTGLAVGSPRYLGLGFQQGLMDMDIQFEAALVPNMSIVGIPLTSFIEANLSPFKKTLSQIPLE